MTENKKQDAVVFKADSGELENANASKQQDSERVWSSERQAVVQITRRGWDRCDTYSASRDSKPESRPAGVGVLERSS